MVQQTPPDPLTTIRYTERKMAASNPNKRCPLCGLSKHISEFHRKSGSASNSYCKPCGRAKAAEWRSKNPEKLKAQYKADRFRPYGITEHDFLALISGQGGVCAICNLPFKNTKDCHIDHCHKSGRRRQILCARCNRGIGMFSDSAVLLSAAAAYLARHQGDSV